MKKTTSEKITFESAYAELEKIVDAFDHGDLTLDQSVASFERGIELAEFLKTRLSEVENRVKKIKHKLTAEEVSAEPEE